jgi:membrane-bound ClpP family serine protease
MRDRLALLVSLLDELAIAGLVLLVLWILNVPISLPVILIIVAFFAVDVIIMHGLVLPALRKRKTTGAEGMIGLAATVVEDLDPIGLVSVQGELWRAESISGPVKKAKRVQIVELKGLTLKVKEETAE